MAALEQYGIQDEAKRIGGRSGKASIFSRLGMPSRYVKILVLVVGVLPVIFLTLMVLNVTVGSRSYIITTRKAELTRTAACTTAAYAVLAIDHKIGVTNTLGHG